MAPSFFLQMKAFIITFCDFYRTDLLKLKSILAVLPLSKENNNKYSIYYFAEFFNFDINLLQYHFVVTRYFKQHLLSLSQIGNFFQMEKKE